VINPLAIGVTLGGLLLDVLLPRPKPQAGVAQEPLPRYRLEDTSGYAHEQHECPPVASGAAHDQPLKTIGAQPVLPVVSAGDP
jgi:hypothetical protein